MTSHEAEWHAPDESDDDFALVTASSLAEAREALRPTSRFGLLGVTDRMLDRALSSLRRSVLEESEDVDHEEQDRHPGETGQVPEQEPPGDSSAGGFIAFVRDIPIWLSGADSKTLKIYSPDRARYSGIGVAVGVSGAISAWSVGLGIHTIGVSSTGSTLIAVVWAIFAIALQRALVSSMRSSRSWLLIPRVFIELIFVLAVSAVVVTPLTLQVFKPQIDQIISVEKLKQQENFIKSLNSNPRYNTTQLLAELTQIQTLYKDELTGVKAPGTTGISGAGPEAARLRAQVNDLMP